MGSKRQLDPPAKATRAQGGSATEGLSSVMSTQGKQNETRRASYGRVARDTATDENSNLRSVLGKRRERPGLVDTSILRHIMMLTSIRRNTRPKSETMRVTT
jgi:hypothetical protein